jgi:hypothetical protein
MRLIAWSLGLTLASSAFAGGNCPSGGGGAVAMCQQAHCTARSLCQDAANTANGYSNQQSGAAGKFYGANQNMSRSSFSLADIAAKSKQAFTSASAYCKQRKTDLCDSYCNASRATRPEEVAPLQQENQKCASDIAGITSQLDSAAAQDAGAQQQAANTGQQSQAQPQSSGGGTGSSDYPSSASPASTASGTDSGANSDSSDKSADGSAQMSTVDCNAPDAYSDERCTGQLTAACRGSSASDSGVCKSFTDLYCGRGSGSSSVFSSGNALKAGSGIGGSYCNSVTAQSFCGDPSKAECPSCRQLLGLPASTSAQLPAVCQTDPMYSTQSATSGAGVALGSVGAGATSAGGGLTGGTATASLDGGAVKPGSATDATGHREGGLGSLEAGGGGGGGFSGYGSSSGSSSGDLGGFVPPSLMPGRPSPSRTVASSDDDVVIRASDIEKRYGPNVFSILSQTLRQRCESGRLLHCGPTKK